MCIDGEEHILNLEKHEVFNDNQANDKGFKNVSAEVVTAMVILDEGKLRISCSGRTKASSWPILSTAIAFPRQTCQVHTR